MLLGSVTVGENLPTPILLAVMATYKQPFALLGSSWLPAVAKFINYESMQIIPGLELNKILK